MSTPNQQQPTPAGWYADPDPQNPGGQRWWDGIRWTEHTQAAPQQNVYAQNPYAQNAYAVAGPVVYPPVAPGTSSLTWQVWLVVGLPLLPTIAFMFFDFTGYFRAVVAFGSAGTGGTGDTGPFASSISVFVVSILLLDLLSFVIYGLVVMFSYFDQRELRRRGFTHPFHWAWSFLSSFVYVIGRTVVVRRRGAGDALWPIWGLVAATVIAIVLVSIKLAIVFSDLSGLISTTGSGYVS
ncbi:DUF2510 domain-containing protein [Humibacter sp. RRB41]|uniref:DUF2510 domain-containing protein n=1 Tax=Humibacter sp. RRB41 TaxID=2919946 RepID=UPI001FAADBAB|nr:DUF2510 domain-containing protein [Humibacter sp. RRB41]